MFFFSESSNEADSEDIDDEEEFLELGDDDVPIVVEHITAPAGKPLIEVIFLNKYCL